MIGRQSLAESIRDSVAERLLQARILLLDDAGFDLATSALTAVQAIEIMKDRKHRDWNDWKPWGKDYVAGACGSIVYSMFDVLAIGEKYQRDA